jgi:hypothetical protein
VSGEIDPDLVQHLARIGKAACRCDWEYDGIEWVLVKYRFTCPVWHGPMC